MPVAPQLEFARRRACCGPAASRATEIVPGPALMPPVLRFALLKPTVTLSRLDRVAGVAPLADRAGVAWRC